MQSVVIQSYYHHTLRVAALALHTHSLTGLIDFRQTPGRIIIYSLGALSPPLCPRGYLANARVYKKRQGRKKEREQHAHASPSSGNYTSLEWCANYMPKVYRRFSQVHRGGRVSIIYLYARARHRCAPCAGTRASASDRRLAEARKNFRIILGGGQV